VLTVRADGGGEEAGDTSMMNCFTSNLFYLISFKISGERGDGRNRILLSWAGCDCGRSSTSLNFMREGEGHRDDSFAFLGKKEKKLEDAIVWLREVLKGKKN